MSASVEDLPIPALMRAARGAYAHSIKEHLDAEGYDDMPLNGTFLVGGLASREVPAADLIGGLGVTRQAASQLIDTLVLRGYVRREPDTADRRRITVSLTPRGQAAGAAIAAGVDAVDEQLAARITGVQQAGLRAGLAALAEIRREQRTSRTGAR